MLNGLAYRLKAIHVGSTIQYTLMTLCVSAIAFTAVVLFANVIMPSIEPLFTGVKQ